MNKILSICMILGAAVLFTACAGEEDDLFDKSAAERLNEMRDVYCARLEAQPAGWAMQYYPTEEEDGYLILADFNADHSVKVAMRNSFTNNSYKECTSLWDVITDNGPVLSFNTYNDLLHIFSDPADTWGGDTGTGIGGDYEFVVVEAPEDASYMMLKGKKRGTYTLLTPLEQGTDFETYFTEVINFQNTYLPMTRPNYVYLKRAEDEAIYGKSFIFELETSNRAMLYPEGSDPVTEGVVYPFIVTQRSGKFYLRFRDQISMGDGEMVREFVYDETLDKFICTDDEKFSIEGEGTAEFFIRTILQTTRWQWQRNNDMSEKMQTAYDDVFNAFKDKGYSLLNMSFGLENNQTSLRINFRQKQSNRKVSFLYDLALDGEDVNITYKGPEADGAQATLDAMPQLASYVQSFNGKYHVTASLSKFDQSSLRLTSANDADYWVDVKMVK